MDQPQPKTAFWQKSWFLYLMLIVIPLVGIILLWTVHKDFSKTKRIILTIIFGIWMFIELPLFRGNNTEDNGLLDNGKGVGTETNDEENKNGVKNNEVTKDTGDITNEEITGIVDDEKAKVGEDTTGKINEVDDFSNVATEYVLSTGNYTSGLDIPAGKSNVTAVKGTGNLSSSNMFSGGINEMFGIDDGSGFYTESFKGLTLGEGDVLSISGNLTIKMEYTKVESNITERVYDEENKITLSSGNYEAGNEFPAGVYNLVAVSGNGNISSSNMFDGGINEMFGINDGTDFYTKEAKHIELPAGTTLEISGGVTVDMIPVK